MIEDAGEEFQIDRVFAGLLFSPRPACCSPQSCAGSSVASTPGVSVEEDDMTHRIQLRLLAALIFAAFLAPGGAPGAAAAEPTQLTISYSQKAPDFLPLWIASDAGYFKKHGLDVTLRYLPAQEGIPALITGQVQIAGTGGADGVSAEAQGAKFKLVATLVPIYAFQFWARPHYVSASALKGQRVGITSTTGSLYAATVLALKELGLTTADVTITPLGGVTNVNSSLLAGSVVAATSHPPATYQFERAGLVDLVDLARRRSLPRTPAFGSPNPSCRRIATWCRTSLTRSCRRWGARNPTAPSSRTRSRKYLGDQRQGGARLHL